MEKLCRLCGQPLAQNETRCSYCGTTTEEYKEPKYNSSYYDDAKQNPHTPYNRPSSYDYPPANNSTHVNNNYANRQSTRVDIRNTSTVIQDRNGSRVYPTRIDPKATHKPAKKSKATIVIISVTCVLFLFFTVLVALVAIIGSIDFSGGLDVDSAVIAASKESVSTEYVDAIENVSLGEPVQYSSNLYDNGTHLVYNREHYQHIPGDEDDYSDDYFYTREFFVFFNREYFQDGELNTSSTNLSYNGDVDVDCNIVHKDAYLSYVYVGSSYEVERKPNFVMNDLTFEVYEVTSPYGRHSYYIFSQPIEEDDWILQISIDHSDEAVDYLDVFQYVVYGKREEE